MSEQITWTHVDKLVRKMHDERGMLQSGMNDAEVTYNMVKFLERTLQQSEICAESRGATIASLQRRLKEALTTKRLSKTKQRLAKLEAAVSELQKQPGHNFVPAFVEGLVSARCCKRSPECMCGMGADGL